MEEKSRSELVKQEFDALFPDDDITLEELTPAGVEKTIEKVHAGLARVDELQREEDADYLWELRCDLLVNQASLELAKGHSKEADRLFRAALKTADEGARKWNSTELAESAVGILELQANLSCDQEEYSRALDFYRKAEKRLVVFLKDTPSADAYSHMVFLQLEMADVWMEKDVNTSAVDATKRAVQTAEEILRKYGEEAAEIPLSSAYMRWGAGLDFIGWTGEGQEPAERLVSFAEDRVAHTDGSTLSRSILSQALYIRGEYTRAKGEDLRAMDDYRRSFQMAWDLAQETGDEDIQRDLVEKCHALTQMEQSTGAEVLKYARVGLKYVRELSQKEEDPALEAMEMYFQGLL